MSFLREILPEQIIELLHDYLDKIEETASSFKDAIKFLNEFRTGEARRALTTSMKKEEEADKIKQKIFDFLESARIDPGMKEDLFYMVKRIDDIADWFKEAARDLVIVPYLDAPQELREGLERLVRIAVKATQNTCKAVKLSLDGEIEKAREIIEEIDILEEEADNVNLENRRMLLEYSEEIKPFTLAILLHDYNRDLEEAVDACQNAGDFLRALMLAWKK